MAATITALYRHPVKGFTPERLNNADLAAGGPFPCDRLFAVENGPSGFDPAAPAFIPKQKFTVLMRIAEVAKARTRYDEATGVLHATAEGLPPISADLGGDPGREAFAAWLTDLLDEEAQGPLKVIRAPDDWRFMDHPQGHVSIINLASVRDLEAKIGRPVDPLRFRGNLYVEGWEPWIENEWTGRALRLGSAEATVFKPIVRCAATHVDPTTAERDMDVVKALFDNYGHMFCGIYVHTQTAGQVAEGDIAELLS
ncbi:MOSC domain-containing protein [Caulobacter mirabilis]|uniref:MOSC domain-containing protein n=1 Tax=Caulobacter mirabilis TaxID=69666 RepID=A0A2D2AUX4_9CAUL|nr:MOSC N-terminal beta barrel domain-containing protein [Caulobacter mirabilis]ATQ41822.1 MOSC domain-containing protein [Caulobacter mirabilis]